MNGKKAIIHAVYLTGDGSAEAFDPLTAAPAPAEGKTAWIHLNAHAHDSRKIAESRDVPAAALRTLFAGETRPGATELGDAALLTLRGVNFNPGEEPEDMVSIRLHARQNEIVSVSRRRNDAVEDIARRLSGGAGPKTAGDFIAQTAAALTDPMDPILFELRDSADALEESMLKNPAADLRGKISSLRNDCIVFRRHLSPQRDAMMLLRGFRLPWLTEADRQYFKDVYDRLTRYLEELEAVREHAQVAQDEFAGVQAEKVTRNLYLLSMITASFMPLTFVTGLLGMNLAGIPLADHPASFATVSLALILLGAIQMFLLKRAKWF